MPGLLASACKRGTLNTANIPINSPHGRLARSVLGSLDAPKHAQQFAGACFAHELPAIVLLKRRLTLGYRFKTKQLVEQLANRTLVRHGKASLLEHANTPADLRARKPARPHSYRSSAFFAASTGSPSM